MKKLTLLSVSLLCLFATAKAIDNVAFWQTFNLTEYDSESFQTRTHGQLRYPDASFLAYYRISQKFYFKVNKHLNFGVHPVYSDRRSSPNSPWHTNYRLELESNHAFKVDKLSFKIRNRYEIRQRVGPGSAYDRFRISASVKIPLKLLPGMESISIGNEVFWNVDDRFINENRFTPVAFDFAIQGTTWSPSIIIQSTRSRNGSDWSENYIAGLTGSFRF